MTFGGTTESQARELIMGGTVDGIVGGSATVLRVLTGGGEMATLEVAGKRGVFIAKVVESGPAAERLRRDRRLGECMATLGIPAPSIEILEVSGVVIGIYRKIEGEDFSIEKLSPEEQDIFVMDLARVLDRLHALPLEDARRILGMPLQSGAEATGGVRFGREWFDAAAFENALSVELAADPQLRKAWDDDRHWFESVRNRPDEFVFGHGDLHSGNVLIVKRPEGWRFAGVVDLQLAGIIHLYDEFLRILLLEEKVIGPRIIEVYNRLPGRRKKIELREVMHAERSFAFYLAHGNTSGGRRGLLDWALRLAPGGAS